MNTVVGIFTTRAAAMQAAIALRECGIAPDRVSVLTPGEDVRDVPTTEAEPPGIGKALGGVVGGAAGAAGGMQAGALASLFVPGVGPVIALGLLGAVALGVAGVAVGGALDTSLREGLPKDEVYVYEDALRRGRSIVVAAVDDGAAADEARDVLARAGAESLDAAREQWWIGLREAEAVAYTAEGRDFSRDEADYRRGFEAALTTGGAGRTWEQSLGELRARYPDVCDRDAFRRGWERGRATEHRRRHAA
jgi:hypothetical protein